VQALVLISFRHDIQIPSEMMLLGKTLLHLEPICRQLDPEMDLVATMREMAVSLLGQQISRDLNAPRLLAVGLELRSLLSEVPANLRRVLGRASSNELRLGVHIDKTEEMQAAIQKVASRITLGLITAALIVGSALLLNVEAGMQLWGYPVFAMVGFILAAGLGLYLVGKIILVDKY
jgi:predicted unusual protein kinase regulating ubiquinone biosynthesis (AarF/ABC1/UbiB family)